MTPKNRLGLPSALKASASLPVRLGDDADPKALRLQQPADDRHAEARMVDIGVAGDEDDVAGIPAERLHLRARHRQQRRRAEALGPVFAVGKEVGSREHGISVSQEAEAAFYGDYRVPR